MFKSVVWNLSCVRTLLNQDTIVQAAQGNFGVGLSLLVSLVLTDDWLKRASNQQHIWSFSIHGTWDIMEQQEYLVSNVSSLLLFGRPDVTWYFHFPLQYFSITTFYISQFSRRSGIRSAAQRNHHSQKKKEEYEIRLCHFFTFS